MLTITNRNNFEFTGRFNGTDYNFPVGATVAVPDDAARHIFGIGQADKTDVLVRHGWMTHSSLRDQAMGKLNGFSFGVANELIAGDVIEAEPAEIVEAVNEDEPVIEQGSAPLQMEAGEEEVSSETTESPVATPTQRGGSILDRLSGS